MLPFITARASEVPLTPDELKAAATVLAACAVSVATVQRRLGIGWNRAADLIVELKGLDALPPVARKLFP